MPAAPRVSVVMPAYNEVQYVDDAIESLRNQTFHDFELLVVDDGSTDGTTERIAVHAAADDRVRALTNDSNRGLPAARNRGLEAARGEYIAPMDADDMSRPERLGAQVRFLDANHHTHVVGTHVRSCNRRGQPVGTWEPTADSKDAAALKRDGPGMAHASTMLRRSSIEAVGGYRGPFDRSDDFDLWVRMAREFGPGFRSVIPRTLFDYRLTPGLFGRRVVDRIYGSFAGDLVGGEDELRERINDRLAASDTTTDRDRQRAMYHFRIGRLSHGTGDIAAMVRHFGAAMRSDAAWTSKRITERLRGRLSDS